MLKKTEDKSLQEAIDTVLVEMSHVSTDSDDYAKMVDQLTKLYALKPKPSAISPDVLVTVGGNIAAVLLIVGYERMYPLTSKALGLVGKLIR